MATLSDIKSLVAGDLHRGDLTAQIATAITDAIDYYSREKFYFLEGRATASTVNGEAFVAVPSDMQSLDSLLITISGSKSPIERVNYIEIDEMDSGSYTGSPSMWAYYADQIRLYPVPNAVYTITLSYHKKLSALSDNGSNAWTTDARNLIRHRAVWDIYLNYLKAEDMARFAKASELDEYGSLIGLDSRRGASGRLRKTDW